MSKRPKRKPIVIVCQCGGYHAIADCPKAWAEFNRWFHAGLAETGLRSQTPYCPYPQAVSR